MSDLEIRENWERACSRIAGLTRRGTQALTLLCLLLSVALPGCRTRSFLSTRQEISMGKEGARQVEQELRVDTSSPDAERVRRIGQKLVSHMGTDRRDVPYSYKVLEQNEVNAFALPGGPIYIFRGLLDVIGDDDDALACIIGHESAHVNGRHAARQMSSNLLTNLLIGFGIPNANVQNAVGLGAQLVSLKYSRDDEYDADRRGLSYAHFAGYDPEGMIRFFGKLNRLDRRAGGDPEWLRTHPLHTARIEKAKVLIQRSDFRYGQ